MVQFYSDVPLEEAKEIIRLNNGSWGNVTRSINTIAVKISKNKMVSLAENDNVMWIEQFPAPFESFNDEARQISGAEVLQEAPYNLDGEGLKVFVYDSGMVDTTHYDLDGRVTWSEDGDIKSHATHIACTVGGTGNRSEFYGGTPFQWRGMAPGVSIISGEIDNCTAAAHCFYNNSGDLESNYNYTINEYDIDLATNSIGINIAANENYPCEWEGDYELTCQLIDGIIRGNLGKQLPVIWANGNERYYVRCGTGYGTTPTPPTMKNSVSVGATDKDDAISSYTSFGPTDDGRIKPDVTAPGTDIYSCDIYNNYTGKLGTSMAAPVVTGNVALMMQAYRQNHNEVMLPSTVKALLVHTAKDLGNPGPDYQFGYGRINSTTAVSIIQQDSADNKLIYEGNITDQNDYENFFVNISEGTDQFRLSLVWTDYPGTPLVEKELVNDLDLIVISPNGERFYPWTLNSSNPSQNAVRDKEDHINNIEQVIVDNPVSGLWRIIISGTVIPNPPQDFSLISNFSLILGKGTIPMNSGWPFYTIDNNPRMPEHLSCLQDMKGDDACNQTWLVKAMGKTNSTWKFFTIYDAFVYSEVDTVETNKVEVTILPMQCGETIIEDIILDYDLINCSDKGIILDADNITLDCNNYLIDGNHSGYQSGIYLNNKQGITIKNCNIEEFYYGIVAEWSNYTDISNNVVINNNYSISLSYSDNNTLLNNTVKNGYYGFYLLSSSDNNLSNNIAQYNDFGVLLYSSSNNNLINNNKIIVNNQYGACLNNSQYNTIWNNNFTNNDENAYETSGSNDNNWNLSMLGNYWDDFEDNIGYPYNYTISGPGDGVDYHPIRFLSCGDTIITDILMFNDLWNCSENGLIIGANDITLNCNGHLIDGNIFIQYYGIYVNKKHGVTIKNCKIQEFTRGIYLNRSSNNILTNNTANDNDNYGISVENGPNNILINNTAKYNVLSGIILYNNSNNTLIGNTANNNTGATATGITLYNSSKNNITDNIANNNSYEGVNLFQNSSNNVLYGNTANNNLMSGIRLWDNCTNNLITSSNFINNGEYGARLVDSENNTFWDNNFTNNDVNAYEDENSNNNNWNLSDVGNYWDDFKSNEGFPDDYIIAGLGEGIDYWPILSSNVYVTELSVVKVNNTERIFRFVITNMLHNVTLNDVNFTLDTGENNISSQETINLTAFEDIFVYVYHNYSTSGNYDVVATATHDSSIDKQSISISV